MEKLFIVSEINVTNPSGSSIILIPKFEYVFSNKSNINLIGGQIYSDITNNLDVYIEQVDGNIKDNIESLYNNNALISILTNTNSNFLKFHELVSTASNIIITKFFDIKDYFLNIQTSLMIFTWSYLFFLVFIIIIYIFYLFKENDALYALLFILVILFFLLILAELLLSSFFVQINSISYDIPRVLNFILTGNYIISGNSADYPAKFGEGDPNMIKMLSTCLNGNGN